MKVYVATWVGDHLALGKAVRNLPVTRVGSGMKNQDTDTPLVWIQIRARNEEDATAIFRQTLGAGQPYTLTGGKG